MKRNFLLMLLLTLLPVVGWATNYNYVSVSWPSATSATFTGGGMALPKPTSVSYYSGGSRTMSATTYTVVWKYNGSEVTVADHAGEYVGTIIPTSSSDHFYSDNGYTAFSGTHTYTINKANNTVSTPEFAGGNTWEYGQTPHAPSSTTLDGTPTFQITQTPAISGSWVAYSTLTASSNPGTWYVRAHVDATVDYNAANSSNATIEILPAVVTVTPGNETAKWSNPFNGKAMSEITPTVTGALNDWNDVMAYMQWKKLDEITTVGNGYAYTLERNSTPNTLYNIVVNGNGTLNVEKNTTGALSAVANGDNLTYNATDQTLNPKNAITFKDTDGNVAGTVMYSLDGTTWAEEIPTGNDAGTYTVYVKGVGDVNHTDGALGSSYQVEIEKATITDIAAWADYFTPPTAVTGDLTYQETGAFPIEKVAQALITPAVFKESVVFADAKMLYDVRDSKNATVMSGATAYSAYDADTYKVRWHIKDAKNFEDYEGTAVEKTIGKANLTTDPEADATAVKEDQTYTGSPLKLLKGEIAKPEFMKIGRAGTFTYYIDGTPVVGTWEDVVGTNADEVKDAYELTYTFVPESKNFNAITTPQPIGNANILKAFVKRTGSPAVVSALTYNAAEQNLIKSGTYFSSIEGGHVIYYAQGTKETDAAEFTKAGDVKKKNNDTYTVSYRFFADDDNHKDDEDVKEIGSVLIDKYEVMVVGNEVKGTIEELYDLTAEPVAPKFANAKFLEDITLLGPDDANRTEILNAIVTPNIPAFDDLKLGDNTVTFTATPEAENNTNYKAKIVGTAGGRLNIQSIEAAIQEDAAPKTDLIYNGADQELIGKEAVGYKAEAGTGTVAIGKVVYSLEEAGEYTDDLTKIVGKDADTYTVYYKVELDKENLDRFYTYTAAVKSFTATIDQKELALGMFTFSDDDMKAEYTGGNLKPTFEAFDAVAGAPEENALTEGDFTVTADETMINVATYTFTITATADGNYKDPDPKVSTTFQITPKALDADMFALVTEGDVIFNGQPQKPTITAADGEGDPNPLVAGDWTYEIKDGEGNVVGIDEMVDADTYTFTFTATSTGNYKDATEAIAKTFVIAQKELTKDMIVFEKTSQPFTGKELTFPYAIAESEEDIIEEFADFKCEKDDFIIDAGKYPFVFTATKDGNYTGSFTVTCEVTPIKQNVVAPKAINLTYNGGEQVLVEAGTTDAVKGSDAEPAGVIEYQVTFGGEVVVEWTSDINEVVGKNAGVYTVESRAIASDVNYTNTPVPNSVDVEIKRADIGYMLSNLEKTWNGEAFSAEEVAKVFTLYAGKLFGDDAYDVPFTLSLPEDYRDADTYTFKQAKVEFKEGYPVNYNVNFTGEAEIVINKANLVEKADAVEGKYDYTAPAKVDGIVYDGTNFDLVTAGEVTTKYEDEPIGTIKFATAEDGEYTEKVPAAKDAGDYTVWYYVEGDKNHNDTKKVKIENSIATKVWTPVVAAFEGYDEGIVEEYDGENYMPKAEDLVLFDGDKAVAESDYTLAITKVGSEDKVTEIKNVGTYKFTYTGSANYAEATFERTITITPKELSGDFFVLSATEAEYNTQDQKPTVSIAEDEAAIMTENDFEVEADEKMINAGVYTFTFTAKEGGNYKNAAEPITADFEINKKEVIAEVVPESAKKTYNGLAGFATLLGAEPVAIKLSYNNPYPNDKFEFVYDNTAFAVADDAIDAGFYDMTVDADKILADNYKAVIDNAEFEIEQATLLINWRSGVTATKVYGAEDPELVTAANVATAGAVNSNDEERILNCIVATYEGENVGKYDITLAADDEADDADVLENYDYTINNEFGKQAFEITAAKIKVSLATQEKPYNGQNAAPDVTASTLIITGLLNGEKKEDVVTEFPVATVNGGEEAVVAGTYDVELSGGKFANYEVEEYLPSVITIVKAQVAVSIEPLEVYAGTPAADIDPVFTVTCGDEDYSEFFKVVVAAKYQNEKGLIKGSGTYADGLVLVIDDLQDAANITGWNNVKGELTVVATVELSDAEDFVSEPMTGVNVTFTERTINTNNWNVVALPFEATIAQISEAFGYAAVDRLNKKAADGNIHFEVVTSGTIPAFEPFIIKTTDDEDLVKKNFTDVVFKGVNIEAWDGENNYVEDAAQNKFWGTFQASTEIYGQKCWYMSKGAWKDARNFTAEKPVTLKPFRAYVEFDEKNVAAGARIYIEEPDGTETAIDAVEFNNMVNGDTYTVGGMKVNKPAQKGIYIQNGKKVAVK